MMYLAFYEKEGEKTEQISLSLSEVSHSRQKRAIIRRIFPQSQTVIYYL